MLRKQDAASRAEIVWVLKTIASSFAAASCDHIAEVFRTMFPDAVPEGFSLNAKKNDILVDGGYLSVLSRNSSRRHPEI